MGFSLRLRTRCYIIRVSKRRQAVFRTRKRIVAQLQEDGSLAKLHRFEDKSDFDVFVSALYTTYWKMQNAKFYREINQ